MGSRISIYGGHSHLAHLNVSYWKTMKSVSPATKNNPATRAGWTGMLISLACECGRVCEVGGYVRYEVWMLGYRRI